MAHKKFYYVLCALVVVIVFGTAAICNMCGTSAAATDKTGTDETVAADKSDGSTTDKGSKDSATESTAKASDTESSDSSSASESTASDGAVPTIKLEIYEGPTYSAGDDICYYRVKATVTGNPAPTVKFSKDDSSGAWGSKKVQVNIHRGQPYTLTATAKNSAGEANASINLTWGCGEENRDPVINDITFLPSANIKTGQPYEVTADTTDPDGDVLAYKWTVSGGALTTADTVNPMKWTAPAAVGSCTVTLKVTDGKGGEANSTKTVNVEPAIIAAAADINVNAANSGYIIVDWAAYPNPYSLFVGDYTNDKQMKTYLCFNINTISDLDNVTIKNASISMPVDAIVAHPELMPEVHVRVFDYGDTLEIADQGSGGEFVKVFPATNPMASFNFTSPELIAKLQAAVNANSQRFQLKFSLSGINMDGVGDYYRFILGDIKMHVEYETPG